MADQVQAAITWAKEHKQIAIPAAIIGGVGVLYLISKSSGGVGVPDGVSNNPPVDQQQADTAGSDNGLSSAVADLQNQLIQQQAEQSAQGQGFMSMLEALAANVQAALSGQQVQTQGALDALAGQTQSALDALYAQQSAYGDNGLGQLLAQIPQYVAQPMQYSSYDPFGFVPTAQPFTFEPLPLPTAIQPLPKLDSLGRSYASQLGNLGSLSGYKIIPTSQAASGAISSAIAAAKKIAQPAKLNTAAISGGKYK